MGSKTKNNCPSWIASHMLDNAMKCKLAMLCAFPWWLHATLNTNKFNLQTLKSVVLLASQLSYATTNVEKLRACNILFPITTFWIFSILPMQY